MSLHFYFIKTCLTSITGWMMSGLRKMAGNCSCFYWLAVAGSDHSVVMAAVSQP